jgi:hypothetical protein
MCKSDPCICEIDPSIGDVKPQRCQRAASLVELAQTQRELPKSE